MLARAVDHLEAQLVLRELPAHDQADLERIASACAAPSARRGSRPRTGTGIGAGMVSSVVRNRCGSDMIEMCWSNVAVAYAAHRLVDERAALDERDELRGTQHDDLLRARLAQLRIAHELDRVAQSLLVPDQQALARRARPTAAWRSRAPCRATPRGRAPPRSASSRSRSRRTRARAAPRRHCTSALCGRMRLRFLDPLQRASRGRPLRCAASRD